MLARAVVIHWALAHPIAAALAGLIGLGVGLSLGELLVTAALAVVIAVLGAARILISLGACLAWGEWVRLYRKYKHWRKYRVYVLKERKRLKSGELCKTVGIVMRTAARKCDLCGKMAELRPYGPKGEDVCFSCLAWDECVRLYRKYKHWRKYRVDVLKERKRRKSGEL